jgi:hypothetical protein
MSKPPLVPKGEKRELIIKANDWQIQGANSQDIF